MSATLPESQRWLGERAFLWRVRGARVARGFTLIEILVVLVIAGFLTGIALPRLQEMVRSIELDGQRKNIVGRLEGLGYRAYSQGTPLRLTSLPLDKDAPPEAPLLQLPAGWQIKVAKPVDYASNGVCSGGMVTIVSPDNDSRPFDMKPPLCRLTPDDRGGGS